MCHCNQLELFVTAHGSDGVRCAYLAHKERVLLCDSHSVGLRRDLNGVLLLDTALQTPVSKSDDVVTVELPLPEVKGNLCALDRLVNE